MRSIIFGELLWFSPRIKWGDGKQMESEITSVVSYVLLWDSSEDFFSSCTRSKTTSSLWSFWKDHGGDILLFDISLSTETHCQTLLSTDGTLTDKHQPPDGEVDAGRSPPGSPEERATPGDNRQVELCCGRDWMKQLLRVGENLNTYLWERGGRSCSRRLIVSRGWTRALRRSHGFNFSLQAGNKAGLQTFIWQCSGRYSLQLPFQVKLHFYPMTCNMEVKVESKWSNSSSYVSYHCKLN